MTQEASMRRYFLNVNPGVEYELSDVEVRDLRRMGFSVDAVEQQTGPEVGN